MDVSRQPLLSSQQANYHSINSKAKANAEPISTAIIKPLLSVTLSFGLRSACTAINIVGTGLIMSNLGSSAAAAASAGGSLQNLVVAASLGFLSATGTELGQANGSKQKEVAFNPIVKASWLMAGLLGTASLGTLLLLGKLMPKVLADATSADAATAYLNGFAATCIPEALLWVNGQIIYHVEKNTWFPFAYTAFNKLGALALSYYFSRFMGTFGVGLGSTVASFATLLLAQLWMLKKAYRDLQIYQFATPAFKSYLCRLLNTGWKFSLQRMTEWANLAIISAIIGSWSNEALTAEQTSLVILNICGLISQGFALGAMQIAAKDGAAFTTALADYQKSMNSSDLDKALHLRHRNYQTVMISLSIGILFSAALAITAYFTRNLLIDLYVPSEANNNIIILTNIMLLINLISIVPDTIRIISGGVLRAWNDILIPTLINLCLMSGAAILVGALIGKQLSYDSLPLFWARIGGIVLAAGFNCSKIFYHLHSDKQKAKPLTATPFNHGIELPQTVVTIAP